MTIQPESVKVLNWSSCYICDPEHAAAQHVCDKHLKELTRPSQSLSEQMQEILEPLPWDHAPVEIHKHGRE